VGLRSPALDGLKKWVALNRHPMLSRIFLSTKTYPILRQVKLGWQAASGPFYGLPSHYRKRDVIREHRARYRLHTFVETGTYLGDMIWSLKYEFDRIYSIEIDPVLAKRAQTLLSGFENVTVLEGNSGDLLPQVLEKLDEPALFWLDAHYSGGITGGAGMENPVLREVRHILADGPGHIILVDDARLFDGTDNYPTLNQLAATAASSPQPRRVEMQGDIICLLP
jgi:hypothetical protein